MWVNLLGILALFAAAVGGLCKYFGFDTSDSPLWVQIPLGIAAVCAIVWLLFNGKNIVRLATSRSARYGVNMFALTLIVAFIIIMINVVVTSQAKQWDTTQNQRNSLADQSIQIVRNLDDEVMITAIQPEGLNADRFSGAFNTVMEMYRAASNNVSYRVVDMYNDPDAVADLPRPLTAGDIYVTYGEDDNKRTEKVETYTFDNIEEKITRALISVSRDEQKVVYFVTRREEKIFDQNQQYSLQALRSGIETQNYEVKMVDLLSEGQVPEDCSVLIIADPDYQFTDTDLTALTNYINRGGQIVAAIDIEPILNQQADSTLVEYFGQFGAEFGRDVVLEQSIQDVSLMQGTVQMGIAMAFQTVAFSDTSDITKDLHEPVFFAICRSVTTDNLPDGVTAEALASASEASWAEDNIELLVTRGAANPTDSRVNGNVPLAQLVNIDLASRPAEFSPAAQPTAGGIPASLTMASPEFTSPELNDATPAAPLGISPQEPEMGFSMDEPAPGGAVEDGGRPEDVLAEPATDELVNVGVEDEMLAEEPDGLPLEDIAVAEEGTDVEGADAGAATQARLLLIGDTTMLTDEFMVPGRTGNRDFVLNAVSFLAAETDLIAIRPKDNINRGFTMTTLDQRIFIVLLIALPLAVAMAGVFVAIRRRRLA